jgi:hypothetical protein
LFILDKDQAAVASAAIPPKELKIADSLLSCSLSLSVPSFLSFSNSVILLFCPSSFFLIFSNS